VVYNFARMTVNGVLDFRSIRTQMSKIDLKVGDIVEIDAGKKLVYRWTLARIVRVDHKRGEIDVADIK